MAELIWDGKYDAHGNKRAPVRIELPFQTVETVNESAQERQRTLELSSSGHDPEWRNRLIWGDKKYVLPSLLPEFAGKVDLIYIDPPFDTGADFSFTASIQRHEESDAGQTFLKEPSILEQKAYRDTWGRGLESYLQWFQETASLLRELLNEKGSIYVHLDYHVSHYCKVVLDEMFGDSNMRNEIIWQRTHAHASLDRFGPIHDTLFYYAKEEKPKYNDIRIEYGEDYVDTFVDRVDAEGNRFMRVPLTAKGTRNGETGLPFRGIDITDKGLHWKYKVAEAVKLPSQFATLAPKVRDFFENKAFGRWVDLNDMVTVRAMSTQVASYVCIQEFSRVLKQLSIADQVPQLLAPDRLLSTCQPFPWSRKVYEANHCVFNMVPCDNDFERAFARFLDNANDVSAFAKLPQSFGFSIDYVDAGMNLRSYYPDFVAVDSAGQHWLIETKGMESAEVSQKDAAASNWCENASSLTSIAWRYVKVPQKGFEVLQPQRLADLAALHPSKLSTLPL